MKGLRLGVLMGGDSPEREISLISGNAVKDALKRKNYNVIGIDVDVDIAEKLKSEAIDVALVLLHGPGGEDGRIQGLLDTMKIAYTGSGVEASAVGMNKWLSKVLFKEAGIPTAEFKLVSSSDNLDRFKSMLPVVVKPAVGGSSLGISIVADFQELSSGVELALKYDNAVLIEKFIDGRELSVGIVDNKALPVIEIIPKSGFYDYTSKYEKGLTSYIVPAKIGKEIFKDLQNLALKVYKLLGCKGVSRVDFRVDQDNSPFVLEINTIPGMAPTSLLPKMAQEAGIDYDQLVEKILFSAKS